MKKRSACKILTGVVAVGLLAPGYCGRITLQGSLHGTANVRAQLINPDGVVPWPQNGVGVECRVCRTVHGPCISAVPRDIRVVRYTNAKDVSLLPGKIIIGTGIRWAPVYRDRENSVEVDITCDNHDRPGWMLVDLGFHRGPLAPQNKLLVIATNRNTGNTTSYEWGRNNIGTWYTKWGDNIVGEGSSLASVSFTYADLVELHGKGSRARILYDVVGTAPVTARIDKIPNGLSCARTSDGMIIESGVAADVGTGESITCTNVRRDVGVTADTLSVTAMIR